MIRLSRILPLLFAALLHGGPLQTMESFVDAVYRYDAEKVFSLLSSESQAAVSTMLAMARLQPGTAAERLSRQAGIHVDSGEISRWSETDLIRRILDAPVLLSRLPERNLIRFSGREMRGDTAIVICEYETPSGLVEEAWFSLVHQHGEWRVAQPFI